MLSLLLRCCILRRGRGEAAKGTGIVVGGSVGVLSNGTAGGSTSGGSVVSVRDSRKDGRFANVGRRGHGGESVCDALVAVC